MRRYTVQHRMQGAFVFVLLGVFAVMSTLLVILGAQMYRSVEARADLSRESRILTSYVRGMVRAEDAEDAVRIEEIDGVETLSLHEMIGQDAYVTRLYVSDGMLCELFTKEERPFDPGHGTKLIEADSFHCKMDGRLLTVRLTYEGGDEECTVSEALKCRSDS